VLEGAVARVLAQYWDVVRHGLDEGEAAGLHFGAALVTDALPTGLSADRVFRIAPDIDQPSDVARVEPGELRTMDEVLRSLQEHFAGAQP
jgi:hypothetical protein